MKLNILVSTIDQNCSSSVVSHMHSFWVLGLNRGKLCDLQLLEEVPLLDGVGLMFLWEQMIKNETQLSMNLLDLKV